MAGPRPLTAEAQHRLRQRLKHDPACQHMAGWVWLSGSQAVAMGLLDAAHSRTWPFRRDTFPTGMAWLDVKHPAASNAAWAWGFTPDYISSIKQEAP